MGEAVACCILQPFNLRVTDSIQQKLREAIGCRILQTFNLTVIRAYTVYTTEAGRGRSLPHSAAIQSELTKGIQKLKRPHPAGSQSELTGGIQQQLRQAAGPQSAAIQSELTKGIQQERKEAHSAAIQPELIEGIQQQLQERIMTRLWQRCIIQGYW